MNRGVALVAVLWALTLLSVIAAGFLRETRTEAYLARNAVENTKARALAEAGINRAILGLTERDPTRRWKAYGTAYVFGFDDGEVRITIEDEIGKIDLNRGREELLVGLFESAGLGPEAARGLVDAMVDYRDPDDLRHLNGAERTDYDSAGLPYGPKNAPFETVAELRQVLGMTRELYERVAPALTVYSGREGFHPRFAPREALLALPGVTSADAVEDYIEARAALAQPSAPEPTEEEIIAVPVRDDADALQPFLPLGPGVEEFYQFGSSAGVYTVRVEARTEGGAVFNRVAVVDVAGTPGRTFRYRLWEQGRPSMAEAPDVDLEAE